MDALATAFSVLLYAVVGYIGLIILGGAIGLGVTLWLVNKIRKAGR